MSSSESAVLRLDLRGVLFNAFYLEFKQVGSINRAILLTQTGAVSRLRATAIFLFPSSSVGRAGDC